MTPEDYRKYLQDTQPQGYSSFPAQITAPGSTDSGASGPANDPARMVDPATKMDQAQAGLEDQFGTGFINFGRYGQGSSDTQQYQPIPASSGSLYDPLAQVAPAAAPTTRSLPAQAPPTDYSTQPAPQEGPVMKPPFQRTRNLLGYRGGDY